MKKDEPDWITLEIGSILPTNSGGGVDGDAEDIFQPLQFSACLWYDKEAVSPKGWAMPPAGRCGRKHPGKRKRHHECGEVLC